MPAKNPDLHGMVPETSSVALLLLDVLNDMEWEGGEALFQHALPMAERLAALKARAHAAGIPAIYVNDNYGRWRSDFRSLATHCLQRDVPGRPIVERLLPTEQDYFVLKPKHSGFYSTTLDTLLLYLRARVLIITGVASNICVLFTANDAYMRDFHLIVPADCVAAESEEENEHAIRLMRQVLKADTRPSTEIDLAALKARSEGP
jgi:nicotinamidase-related amidase